jgi:hypothetical protein
MAATLMKLDTQPVLDYAFGIIQSIIRNIREDRGGDKIL